MNTLKEKLISAVNGRSVLFLGAGFSYDSINFDGSTLPSANPLLNFFNASNSESASDLPTAASIYRHEQGDTKFVDTVSALYDTKQVSESIDEIMSFPWKRIYTTNYDNAAELGLRNAGVPFRSVSISERPDTIPKNRTHVVHLHGSAERLSLENIDTECVMDNLSYANTPAYGGEWSEQFRLDMASADIVVFIGYSLFDVPISQMVRQSGTLKSNTYFINSTSESIGLKLKQQNFGEPCFIGRDGFARILKSAKKSGSKLETRTYGCFTKFKPLRKLPKQRTQQSLENLFLLGKIDREILLSDVSSGDENYTIDRTASKKLIQKLKPEKQLFVLFGPLGHGKSIVLEQLPIMLNRHYPSRPVYVFGRDNGDVATEFLEICSREHEPIFLVDDFFRLKRLWSILSSTKNQNVTIVASARFNIFEMRSAEIQEQFVDFECINLPVSEFDREERSALVPVLDTYGRWQENQSASSSTKELLLANHFKNNFADLLIGLMDSSDMKSRFKSELDILKEMDRELYLAVHLVLYFEFIGVTPDGDLLSVCIGQDLYPKLVDSDVNEIWKNFLIEDNQIAGFRSSVMARFAIQKMCDVEVTLDALALAINNLSRVTYNSSDYWHAFKELLRFSFLRIISTTDTDLRSFHDFYSKLASIEFCQNSDLFWLQYAMCSLEAKDYNRAHAYLENSYSFAKKNQLRDPGYEPYQTDNQMIRCLVYRNFDLVSLTDEFLEDLAKVLPLMIKNAQYERDEGKGQAYQWTKDLCECINLRFKEIPADRKPLFSALLHRYASKIRGYVTQQSSETSRAAIEMAAAISESTARQLEGS